MALQIARQNPNDLAAQVQALAPAVPRVGQVNPSAPYIAPADPNAPIDGGTGQPTTQPVDRSPLSVPIEPTLDPNKPVPGTTYQTGGYATPGYIPAAYSGGGLAGFDSAKLSDPTYLTPKYEWARIAASSPDPDTAKARLQQAYPGTTFDGDVAHIPGVGNIDLYQDYGGANNIQWLDKDYQAQQAALDGAPAAAAPLSGGSSAGGASALLSSAASSSSSPYGSDLDAAIKALLETPQTVDAQTLLHSPEAEGFRISAERSADNAKAQAAESAAYNGTSNLSGVQRGIDQSTAESEAQFVGSIAQAKLQDAHDRLVQGIQFAEQAGQFEESKALQLQLAEIDAQIRQAQIAESARESDLRLGFDYTQLQTNANAQAAALGL